MHQLRRSIDRRRVPDLSKPGWEGWFAWYPVIIAIDGRLAYWAWMEFVERKWTLGGYIHKWSLRYQVISQP
jgi:hypothetical protein